MEEFPEMSKSFSIELDFNRETKKFFLDCFQETKDANALT